MLPVPFVFKEGRLSQSNRWLRKWKEKKKTKFWDIFVLPFYLFVLKGKQNKTKITKINKKIKRTNWLIVYSTRKA